MIEELGAALSDVGVARQFVHKEPYFNGQHRPDPAVVAAIRERFVAEDVFCALPQLEASLFQLDPLRPRNTDPTTRSEVSGAPFLSGSARAS